MSQVNANYWGLMAILFFMPKDFNDMQFFRKKTTKIMRETFFFKLYAILQKITGYYIGRLGFKCSIQIPGAL